MIAKKSIGADLEKRRFAFFQIGLLLSGSLVLAAFEYQSATGQGSTYKVPHELDNTIFVDPVVEYDDEEQPPQKSQTQINIEDVDSVHVVEELKETKTTFKNEGQTITIDEKVGEGDVFTGIIPENNIDSIFTFVTHDPQFPGGETAMYRWVMDHVKYPQEALLLGEQGTVWTTFVVNADGSISQVHVERGVSESLDVEAMRVIRSMPKWVPGEHMGKQVRVRYTLPIKFISSK